MKATHLIVWYGGRTERVAILEDNTYESPYEVGTHIIGGMRIWSESEQAERWINFGIYNALGIEPLKPSPAEMTAQQREITQAVDALLELLDRVIPRRVAHYAVEGIRVPLQVLKAQAHRIHTHDWSDD